MKRWFFSAIFILFTIGVVLSPAFAQSKGKSKGDQERESRSSKKNQKSISSQGRDAGELPGGLDRYGQKHEGQLPKGLEKMVDDKGELPKGLEEGGKKNQPSEKKGKKKSKKKAAGKGKP